MVKMNFTVTFVSLLIKLYYCCLNKINLKEITDTLERIAPLSYQESYDNAGLITGHPDMTITGALICLDSTEEVITEAIRKNCNLVIAHHPIVFSGLKKINGKNYVERTVISSIKNDIAIYAIHTNLDNVRSGVNARICNRLGLQHTRILDPKHQLLCKLVTFVPEKHAEKLRAALFEAGGGSIGNYDSCSFNINGTGTFRGNEQSNPFAGKKGTLHEEKETRVEIIYEKHRERAILAAMLNNHPYEEAAYDCYALQNSNPEAGSGMIGELEIPMEETAFLEHLKTTMLTGCIRHTRLRNKKVKTVAVAGGAGSFLLQQAIRGGADFFVTADYKYHQFFDADNHLVIADIGHYESEQFTKDLIADFLKEKFPTFAVHLSEINTNPIKYF